MRAYRVAATVVALTAVLTAVGCGGDGQDPDTPAVAIRELQAAFAAQDLAIICARLTPTARKQAGSVAHGFPTRCKRDVRRALGLVEEGGGWGRRPRVGRIRRNGDRATATLVHDGRWQADVPLEEDDGIWKLAGFFGTAPAKLKAIERTARARPFPPVDGRAVKAFDGDGRPCGELSETRYPFISGGCTFVVSGRDVPFRILTPFGDFKFGECMIDYRLSIGSDGRTWTQDWDVEGSSITGCSDIVDCRTPEGEWLPWKGRLSSDGKGGFLHRSQMCMRTCIGEFAGDFVTRLTRTDRGWRVEPTDEDATGFKVDGDLRVVSDKGLQIRRVATDGY